MKQLIAVLTLAIIVAGGIFLATHHAVYGPCKPHRLECEKTLLRYEGNK